MDGKVLILNCSTVLSAESFLVLCTAHLLESPSRTSSSLPFPMAFPICLFLDTPSRNTTTRKHRQMHNLSSHNVLIYCTELSELVCQSNGELFVLNLYSSPFSFIGSFLVRNPLDLLFLIKSSFLLTLSFFTLAPVISFLCDVRVVGLLNYYY